MITRDEIYKFADILDKEYADEIKPLLKKTHEAVDGVLSPINGKNFANMRKRANLGFFRFDNLPFDIQQVLAPLRFYGDNLYDGKVNHHSAPFSLTDWNGYCMHAMDDKLRTLLSHNDHYRDNDVKALENIRKTKETFNEIRKAYNMLFVENGGDMFKRFTNAVNEYYNIVATEDGKLDSEFYALFESKPKCGGIKITVTIEEI